MLGKRRVPLPLKNLQQGLLDQSVDDARHAEHSDPAVRLGDFDPFDRLRLVGSFEQLAFRRAKKQRKIDIAPRTVPEFWRKI